MRKNTNNKQQKQETQYRKHKTKQLKKIKEKISIIIVEKIQSPNQKRS